MAVTVYFCLQCAKREIKLGDPSTHIFALQLCILHCSRNYQHSALGDKACVLMHEQLLLGSAY